MKRAIMAIAFAFMALCGAVTLSAQEAEQQILFANDQNHQALVAGDIGTLSRVLLPSFVSHGGNAIVQRDQLFNGLLSGTVRFTSVTATNRIVTLNADGSATVTGTRRQVGTFNGIDISGEYPFLTQYVNTAASGWAAAQTAVLQPCTRPPAH
jgi:hypothetical protein